MRDTINAFTSYSGGSRGGARPNPPFLLDQPEALKGRKNIFRDPPTPPSCYLKVWIRRWVIHNTVYLFLRDVKLAAIERFYLQVITLCTPFWEMPNSFWGIPLIYKLHIYKVYLLAPDAKLLMTGSIYKLYINTVYLLLRDTKLLQGDSIYKLKINTFFWGMPTSFWGIPC